MKFQHLLMSLLTMVCVASCGGDRDTQALAARAELSTTYVDAAVAHDLLSRTDVVILDVRTPGEFAQGHIRDAVNVDFMDDSFRARVAELDREDSYLIHCAVGGRSRRSVALMEELGFTSLYHLDGGMKAWVASGLSTEQPAETRQG